MDENGRQIYKNFKGRKVLVKGLKPEEVRRRRWEREGKDIKEVGK